MSRFLFAISLLFLCLNSTKCQERGNGCRISNTVFTQYLGLGTPYVGQSDQPYYASDGRKLELNNNNGARYVCGAINDYPQGSYYDSSIPPYGATVTIPMQHELVSESSVACVTALQVNGSIVNAGGRVVTYELNPLSTCSTSSRNDAPLDDFFPFLALIVGGVGFAKVRRKG